MLPRLPTIILICVPVCFGFASNRLEPSNDALFTDFFKPVFEENCIPCHGKDDKEEGDMNLLELESLGDLTSDLERLQTIFDVLDFKEMPPEEEPPLDNNTHERILTELKALLDQANASQITFPQTPIRRMNRFQYNNAVQDLFDLNVEVFPLPERIAREYGNYFNPASGVMPVNLKAGSRPLGKSQLIEKRLAGIGPFPQDLRAEHGFDNRGDHLTLSPLLMESFLTLSRSIVESPDFNEKTCGIWEFFFTKPSEDENLKLVIEKRLRTFLTRAFRGPVDADTLDRYSKSTIRRIQSGDTFFQAMKIVASAALASPRFLYLYDRPESESEKDNSADLALASRLSFFLWGSLPDSRLLQLGANGTLGTPEILTQEVERMLDDDRLKRFCDSFPSQWLQLDRIISSTPDPDLWPDFYFAKYRGSMHMMLEPLLLFETILVENRSILELIDSNYSYRSEYLRSWYQDGTQPKKMPPTAIPFERVALDDRRQGGVITTAAVMTMTSNATRSKPITRGTWMSTVIFNNPPEPPPANVPPLPEESDAIDLSKLTLRERLEAHRENQDCAGCHNRIDPLGFALENYGPTGLWRDQYENGRDVDSEGILFRKHPFNNIVEFKDAILAEKDRFTKAFAGHLLSFALGREISAADHSAIDHIAQETINDGYRIQTLMKQIIMSEPFRQKRDLN